MTGYLSSTYASALAEFGAPKRLPASNGWIIERRIPGSDLKDGLGCYPLFCCEDWTRVGDDLRALSSSLVSVALVTDPFGDYDTSLLDGSFDRVVKFKEHYVVDLREPLEETVKRSHRATVRRALKKVEVQVCENPGDKLADWQRLFANLVARHDISGLRAFSPKSFERQFEAPGLVAFEATVNGETVGLDLWYVQGDVAYGHLVAFSDLGYKSRASYATKWTLLNYFRDKVRWVNLGGAPGVSEKGTSGLDSFKSGWSTGTKTAFFCGSILREDDYRQLSATSGSSDSDFFPAYRAGEFN